jgi:hypothetical protein
VGFRDKMRHLENAARDNLASFELVDGSCFYYELASPELFLHICDGLTNHDKPKRPKPPEMVEALARAKDRRAAFSQIGEGGDMGLFPYEVEALVERGEIVARSLVVGYELGEPLPDLSE